MSRRRTDHDRWHDIFVALWAVTALVWAYLLVLTLDHEEPPPPPSGGATTPERATQAAQPVSRGNARTSPPTPSATPRATTTPTVAVSSGKSTGDGGGRWSDLPPVLRCIRAAESGGNYRAFNGVNHYGAYQLSAAYSDAWAVRYGHARWADLTADYWPRVVQDDVARQLFADWPRAWTTFGGCS